MGADRRGARPLAIAVAVALIIAGAVLGLIPARAIGAIVDGLEGENGLAEMLWRGAALALATAASATVTAYGFSRARHIGTAYAGRLRRRALDRLQDVPNDAHQFSTGDLATRLGDDVQRAARYYSVALPTATVGATGGVVLVIGLAALDPWAATLAVLPGLLVVPAIHHYERSLRRLARPERVLFSDLAEETQSWIYSRDAVASYLLQPEAEDRFNEVAERYAMIATQRRSAYFSLIALVLLLQILATLSVLFVVSSGFHADERSMGDVVAAVFYVHQLFAIIESVAFALDDIHSGSESAARLRTMEDSPSTVVVISSFESVSSRIRLSLRNVTYTFPDGRPGLDGASFTISGAETVAIVGASGAGKSTLARLTAGLVRPTKGIVVVDDAATDVAAMNSRLFRIGLITQNPFVPATTIAEGLRFSKPVATLQEIWGVLEAVGAAEWVARLNSGLDTVVGQGGEELADYQTQQLAIARMIMANPAVAILDEPTAELGDEGSVLMERALREVARERAVLTVVHRLDQAVEATKVVVMERGRIVETGTHRELLRRSDGMYRELWEEWMRYAIAKDP